jgi:hypothetical protein
VLQFGGFHKLNMRRFPENGVLRFPRRKVPWARLFQKGVLRYRAGAFTSNDGLLLDSFIQLNHTIRLTVCSRAWFRSRRMHFPPVFSEPEAQSLLRSYG